VIKFLKIELVLKVNSKVLFAILGKTRELQKKYSTFDAQKAKKYV